MTTPTGFCWMRLFGDTIFAIEAMAFVYFAIDIMRRERPLATKKIPTEGLGEAS